MYKFNIHNSWCIDKFEGGCQDNSPVITPEIELMMSNNSAWMRVKQCLHTDVFHRAYVHIINFN